MTQINKSAEKLNISNSVAGFPITTVCYSLYIYHP